MKTLFEKFRSPVAALVAFLTALYTVTPIIVTALITTGVLRSTLSSSEVVWRAIIMVAALATIGTALTLFVELRVWNRMRFRLLVE